MSVPYSLSVVRELERVFLKQELVRRRVIRRYEAGDVLSYDITGVFPPRNARVELSVDRFVGGGFAGQVYKTSVAAVHAPDGSVAGVESGRNLALKLLAPASGFARAFRGLVYAAGFQAPFSLQSNPDAVRAGALWQKFIRRAARNALGSEEAVVDIRATLLDSVIGTYGELSEWVEGRLWRFEVDDRLFERLRWKPGRPEDGLGSPEYRAKRLFMHRLVGLMHEMGAVELARQYEWWTLKSQPNSLKRREYDSDPEAGLTAVDFRAGLAVLPFLPQSPADIGLILRGVSGGRFVQFDRGDTQKLRAFTAGRQGEFSDMQDALDDLETSDRAYRESQPDITRHHVRLLTRRSLRRSIARNRIRSWAVRNIIDPVREAAFTRRPAAAALFFLMAFLPLLAPALLFLGIHEKNPWLAAAAVIPLLGPFLRKLWGREDFRRHAARLLRSPAYLRRALRGRAAETVMSWHRSGRVSERRALKLAASLPAWTANLPLSVLPPGLHRFVTDRRYALERLHHLFVRPFRLYFNAGLREKWLLEMIAQGEKNGMLSPADAAKIRSQIGEPYIQKYLKSLAIHLCTLFVSETVYVTTAVVYVLSNPDLSWQQATLQAGLIVGALNLLPVSPGSLVRGVYVLALIAREKNFKDYGIALFLSFFKIIGYLAFPVQMAYKYPELARFMAGHWATEAVHIVPVFGERGAWLEHAVFDAFYNYPLSLRRRILDRNGIFGKLRTRATAAATGALGALTVLAGLGYAFFHFSGRYPSFRDFWWGLIGVPLIAGGWASLVSRRPALSRRILTGALAAGLAGAAYPVIQTILSGFLSAGAGNISSGLTWSAAGGSLVLGFAFALLGVFGAFIAENLRPVNPSKRRIRP